MKRLMKLCRLINVLPDEVREHLNELVADVGDDLIVKRTTTVSDPITIDAERVVEGYISTREVDRDREVLDPAGADLSLYKLNPVVLWAHDYSQPPIAKTLWIRADDYGVKARRVYAETDRANEIWQLVKGGFLRTTSVGFIPLKRVFRSDPEWSDTVRKLNEKWGVDLEKAGAEIITTKWALLEYSDVPVPANPYALNTAIGKGLNISDDLLAQLGVDNEIESAEEESKCHVEADVGVGEAVEKAAEENNNDTENDSSVVPDPNIVIVRKKTASNNEVSQKNEDTNKPPIIIKRVTHAGPVIVKHRVPEKTWDVVVRVVAREALDQLRGRA